MSTTKFSIDARVIYDHNAAMKRLNMEDRGKVQQVIDSEVLRLCEPLVPFENGDLVGSGNKNTVIGSGEVVYHTLYARKQYYIPMEHEGKRTEYWFEHMKQEGGIEAILKKARGAIGK